VSNTRMGALILMLFVIVQVRGTRQEPPLPYVDRGACPFECCQYGDWVARRRVVVREFYDEHRPGVKLSRQVSVIQVAAHVVAMTGVVVTTRAGRMRVLEPLSVSVYSKSFPTKPAETLKLAAGDILYKLHESGEGAFVGWFKGRVLEEVDGSTFGSAVQQETAPQTTWWAQVRTHDGAFGWVRAEQNFDNQDRCGR
jgi:hypothetical protein